ncbi:MAG: HEPN domain-containing protein [Melioribacteraceae bacterium]|nr:HEPN domain-containing protein [Melioribacteraceae bacterium]
MIDFEKQIEYWKNGAIDDLESAKILIERNRLLHGLFFCHLAIEKIMKAHVVKRTKELAPRSHNLIYLSEKANLEFTDDYEIFLGILMKYQLQGRYPDYNPIIPDKPRVLNYLIKTEKLLTWLQEKL